MNPSHRRPLVAYVLVTLAGAVVVAQGLAMSTGRDGPLTPFLDLDRVVAERQLIAKEPAPLQGAFLDDGVNVDPDTLTPVPATPAGPEPVSDTVEPAEGTTSAAPDPDESQDTVRSSLVAAGQPGNDTGTGGGGGKGDDSAGDDDDPVFGSPPLTVPGDGDGTPGDGEPVAGEPGAGDDPDPKPHDFDDGNPNGHPYGPAQPPRGPGHNNGQGHGHGQDGPPGQDTSGKGKPDKPGKGKPDKPGKQDKADKPGKGQGLAKGQGKVKPGDKGKKNG